MNTVMKDEIRKSIEHALRRELDRIEVPTGFHWHLHSMDVANLVRVGFGSFKLDTLVGYPVHVDDRYPRWFQLKPELKVHDEAEYTINAAGMLINSLARYHFPLKGQTLKTEGLLDKATLYERLKNALEKAARCNQVDAGMVWYLHPEIIHDFSRADLGCYDAGLKCQHPDDTTYTLLGHRVRCEPNASRIDAEKILRESMFNTTNDQDWYLLWARKWNVDRKTAKHTLLFYVYDNEQSLKDKRLIRKHYAKLATDDKTKFSVDAETPASWTNYVAGVYAGGNPEFLRRYAELDCMVSNQVRQKEVQRAFDKIIEALISLRKQVLK